jgi:hypothetical protein
MIDFLDENSAVLPLYSFKNQEKYIPEKSGLNQWNAGGRVRNPGESYIPVPKTVHTLRPDLFPRRDLPFELLLPNDQTVLAKLCQSGSKALMSSPNDRLNFWLFQMIDGSISNYVARFSSHSPYRYEDLQLLGFDSLIFKVIDGSYSLTIAPVGTFEDWVNQNRSVNWLSLQ